MKRLALPLAAALVLAACSNPADGLNPALLAGTSAPAATEAPAQQTAESGQETEVQPEAQAPAKKGVAVDWDMDLNGYEEAPKDSVYGINWVYVTKHYVDNDNSYLVKFNGDIKVKPVEFHASDSHVQFLYSNNGMSYVDEGAYKCVIYIKKDLAKLVYEFGSCDYRMDNDWNTFNTTSDYEFYTNTKSCQIKANRVESFKAAYGQY